MVCTNARRTGQSGPRLAAMLAVMLSAILSVNCHIGHAGTTTGVWTKLTNSYPLFYSGTMLLLTDGTVMVQGPGVSSSWNKLTPTSTGSYVNGTWSSMASMGTSRLYVASNIMPNGKVFVLGGEYSGPQGAQNITNTGEIYDPVANTWSPITFPLSEFGDDPSVLLPNGKILLGYIFDQRTYLFNPSNNTFTQTGSKLRNDASDEETWVMLPNGNVLSYDIFASPSSGAGSAQVYNATTGAWSDAGVVPVPLTGPAYGYELGPATMLPNGKMIQIGANNNTAIYTPSSNTWTQGPSLPANMGSDDAPGVMLPDGHFIFVADTSSPQVFSAPSIMLDYDYTTNTVTDITSTLPSTLQNTLAASSAYVTRFLMLPNGHALFNDGNGGLWEYAPTGAPQSTWRPTITSITKGTGGNPVYTLTGTQLTGLWQGASYGDDAEMDTNYPIVSIVGPSPANTVHYARTTNWTPGISSVGSTTKTTVQFTLPAGLANGTYKLYVSANGISSAAFTFTLPYTNAAPSNYVTASYSAGTLTLTDDAADNAVVVTQQGTILTVQGAGTTLIKVGANSSQSATFNVGSTVNVTGNFTNGGNNTVSFVSVNSPNLTLTFGSGNDTTNLTYSTIGILTLDGGAGTDNLVPVTTKITTKHVTNVP